MTKRFELIENYCELLRGISCDLVQNSKKLEALVLASKALIFVLSEKPGDFLRYIEDCGIELTVEQKAALEAQGDR